MNAVVTRLALLVLLALGTSVTGGCCSRETVASEPAPVDAEPQSTPPDVVAGSVPLGGACGAGVGACDELVVEINPDVGEIRHQDNAKTVGHAA